MNVQSGDEIYLIPNGPGGNKLTIIIGLNRVGIRIGDAADCAYLSIPETCLFIHSLLTAIAQAAQNPEDDQ